MHDLPPSPESAAPVAESTNVYVSIGPDVTFSTRQYGDRTSYVAHHGQLGQYFRLGVEEYHVATLLDGSRTVSDVHRQITADGLDWAVEDVAKFTAELVRQKICIALADASEAESNRDDANASAPRQPPVPWTHKLTKALSLAVSQRFPLMDGQFVAKHADRVLGLAFTRFGFALWVVLVGSGLMVVFGHDDQFAHEIRRLFDPGIWVFLLVFWVLAKILHEAGHAVCAYRHQVKIGNTGIMFFLFAPLAYIDVTDAWKLRSRISRVQIALAGVYLELAVAAIAAWAWWFLPDGTARHFAAQIFLVAGPASLLVNANPLLRLDGYYVLSDLLEIPNLRMHGRAQLVQRIERILFSVPKIPARLHGWRRPVATLHALCSVVFQFFWMTGLVVAVSMWAKGLGLLIAGAACLLWALLPLARWIAKIWKLESGGRFGLNLYRRRMLGYVLVLITLGQQLSFSSSPLDRRVPVVVCFQNEQIARASADAFVESVYVQRGDRVRPGMLLLELSHPELMLQRDQKADDILMAEQRAVQMRRRGEISQAAGETENAASLKRQLAELDEQIAGLRVEAKRDGLITSTAPQRLKGVYVKKGQELIRVSDPREKELLAVVGKDDMAAYQAAAQSQSASSVRLRGGTSFRAWPTALLPRAVQSLPHPALAASVGGPVAVEPASNPNEAMQMIQPHGQSKTPLDAVTSMLIHSGQIGTMTISDDRSLLTRIYDDLIDSSQLR
ncbi:MAG: biotin/lipoyl-binding protein [Pirellulaceae bacterium]